MIQPAEKFILLLLMLLFNPIILSQKVNVEQYFYSGETEQPLYGGIAGYTSNNNWHTEARYNYEDIKTFSFYTGKTFSKEANVSYEATPMLGFVAGKLNGGSIVLNLDVNYKNWYFSAQPQYTFSIKDKSESYFFNWSEAGIDITSWMYGGLAMQNTRAYRSANELTAGIVIGFSLKNWTMPVYFFNPLHKERFFVIDVIWEWGK